MPTPEKCRPEKSIPGTPSQRMHCETFSQFKQVLVDDIKGRLELKHTPAATGESQR
jgi:hypothetical protein